MLDQDPYCKVMHERVSYSGKLNNVDNPLTIICDYFSDGNCMQTGHGCKPYKQARKDARYALRKSKCITVEDLVRSNNSKLARFKYLVKYGFGDVAQTSAKCKESKKTLSQKMSEFLASGCEYL